MIRAMSDILEIEWRAFEVADPWRLPPGVEPLRLRRSTDGSVPRLTTTVAVWRDETFLTFLFSAADDHVVATYFERDDPLYDEDVVEVFVAPETPTVYYEVEVSPLATIFDARIESPDGRRATMRADPDWHALGLFAAVRRLAVAGREATVDTLLRIPFDDLGRHPRDGETWRANLFRIDRHPIHGDEYSAWCPTMKDPADFHVPAAFGSVRFAPRRPASGR